jgi:hypothetical protein
MEVVRDAEQADWRLSVMQNRMLWVVLTVLIGGVQALDSGALQAGSAAQALIVVGIAAPALALMLTEKWEVWLAALIAGAGLLVWARVVSVVSLNALHIGMMVPAIYILFVCRLEKQVARQGR